MKDNTYFTDKYDDQHQQIKDNLDITESTDSETTDIIDFRVVNKNNSYPLKNNKGYNTNFENNNK